MFQWTMTHTTEHQVDLDEEFEVPHASGCLVQNCRFCCSVISYISGSIVRQVSKLILCEHCVSALLHSDEDPCSEKSLIYIKSYNEHLKNDRSEDGRLRGLMYPSNSVLHILLATERNMRDRRFSFRNTGASEKLLHTTLKDLQTADLFPGFFINGHLFDADGIDNHYWILIRLLIKKYAMLQFKKLAADTNLAARNISLGQKTVSHQNCNECVV